jgi:hypothetical protein
VKAAEPEEPGADVFDDQEVTMAAATAEDASDPGR